MSGRTAAFLYKDGNTQVSNDRFTILVIIGESSLTHSLRIDVGTGSREHDLDGADFMILIMSSGVTRLNLFIFVPTNALSYAKDSLGSSLKPVFDRLFLCKID